MRAVKCVGKAWIVRDVEGKLVGEAIINHVVVELKRVGLTLHYH